MKFLNWVKKHLILSFVIVIFPIAAIVGGTTFIVSKTQYNSYLKEYNKTQDANKLKIAALPKSVFIDNDYITYGNDEVASSKSSYKNSYLYFARDAVVAPLSEEKAQEYKKIEANDESKMNEYITSLDRSGGAITFKIEVSEAGYGDIAIAMRTNWLDNNNTYLAYDNITDQIKIQFNKLEIKTENLTLPSSRDEFTTLVLKDVVLLKGLNTLTFTTSAYNPYKTDANKILYVMPDIRNVAVVCDATAVIPE